MSEFARVGLAAAQVSDIARRAGVAYGTFYTHFESKNAVLLECSRRTAARVREALDARDPESFESAEAFFRDVAITHYSAPIDAPTLRSEVWMAAIQQPEDPEHAHIAHLTGRIVRLQDAGRLESEIPAATIARLWLRSLMGFLARDSNEEDLAQFANVFGAGLRAPQNAATPVSD